MTPTDEQTASDEMRPAQDLHTQLMESADKAVFALIRGDEAFTFIRGGITGSVSRSGPFYDVRCGRCGMEGTVQPTIAMAKMSPDELKTDVLKQLHAGMTHP